MNKLKLELDSLEVQSFDTGPEGASRRGTVQANAQTMETCFTFDQDTCDCTDNVNTECCDNLPPTVNPMDCDSWWYSCRACGSGPGQITGDRWALTCS